MHFSCQHAVEMCCTGDEVARITMMIADDHTLVRAGLRALLEDMGGNEIIAEAADGREAIRLAETHRPDIILMDVSMPLLNGIEATAQLAKRIPTSRVIILSMYAREEYLLQALRAGAAGYLLKDAATTELERAVRTVAQGGSYISTAVSGLLARDSISGVRAGVSPERLTPRQREVLQLIAEGRTTKEIAFMLSISVKTADTYRTQLMNELDIHNVAGLVRYAIRMGLVSPES